VNTSFDHRSGPGAAINALVIAMAIIAILVRTKQTSGRLRFDIMAAGTAKLWLIWWDCVNA
jgi:hypothetical protein